MLHAYWALLNWASADGLFLGAHGQILGQISLYDGVLGRVAPVGSCSSLQVLISQLLVVPADGAELRARLVVLL